MQITRTRTRYYLLSVLGALAVAVGVLALAPSAQAQVEAPPPQVPGIDKECSPNPVQIGQQITCTIDVVAAPESLALFRVEDTLPAGLTVIGATSETTFAVNGVVEDSETVPCAVAGNTVECPETVVGDFSLQQIFRITDSNRVTIEARADQCGTFENTARAEGLVLFVGEVIGAEPIPFTVEDTEEITVEGCEVPPAPEPGQQQPNQQQPDQQQGAPITQDFEQDSEAGEIDQTFDIS